MKVTRHTRLRWSIISTGFGLSIGATYSTLSHYSSDAGPALVFLLSFILSIATILVGLTYTWEKQDHVISQDVREIRLRWSSEPAMLELPQSVSSYTTKVGSYSHYDATPNVSYDDDQYKWEKLVDSDVYEDY